MILDLAIATTSSGLCGWSRILRICSIMSTSDSLAWTIRALSLTSGVILTVPLGVIVPPPPPSIAPMMPPAVPPPIAELAISPISEPPPPSWAKVPPPKIWSSVSATGTALAYLR